jgi:hypothetical protein
VLKLEIEVSGDNFSRNPHEISTEEVDILDFQPRIVFPYLAFTLNILPSDLRQVKINERIYPVSDGQVRVASGL